MVGSSVTSHLTRQLVVAVSSGLLASIVAAPPAGADITASIQAGALVVEDDAGASTEIVVAEYSDPMHAESYYAPNGVDRAKRQFVGTRAGPGCTQAGRGVRCPVGPVTSIVVLAGDGDDWLRIGGLEPESPNTGRPCAVPATVDGGAGDDQLIPPLCPGQAVVMRGGDGNDLVTASNAASSVRAEGGPGNDKLGVTAGATASGDVIAFGGVHPASVLLDGGPGEDSLLYVGEGGPRLVGGDGDDNLMAWRTTEPAEVRGDEGNDELKVELNAGPVLADAGDGDDRLKISRSDSSLPRVPGGIVDARAGPGDDALLIGDDGDTDLIDCGPGDDEFWQLLLGVSFPPEENRYVNCPIVGVRLASKAAIGEARDAIRLAFTSPQRGSVRISMRQLYRKRRLGRAQARLRRGGTRVTVVLNRAGRRLLRDRGRRPTLVVRAAIRSRTGDIQTIIRRVRVG